MLKAVPKPVRVRDDEARAYVRSLPCLLADRVPCLCGGYLRVGTLTFVSDCAHVKSRGSGGGDRENIVPLCRKHHAEQHRIGTKAFEKRHELNMKQEAKRVWADYVAQRDAA